jgi:hypothetical protein
VLNRASQHLPRNFSDQSLSAPTPTLPIILISLFVGLGTAMLGLYIAYAMVGLSREWSAAVSTLGLVGAVSGVAAFLSALHDRRTIGMNIGFSCALTFLLLAFVGFCLIVGIFAATIAQLIG